MRAQQKGVFRLFSKKYKVMAPEGTSSKIYAYVSFENEQDTFKKQEQLQMIENT